MTGERANTESNADGCAGAGGPGATNISDEEEELCAALGLFGAPSQPVGGSRDSTAGSLSAMMDQADDHSMNWSWKWSEEGERSRVDIMQASNFPCLPFCHFSVPGLQRSASARAGSRPISERCANATLSCPAAPERRLDVLDAGQTVQKDEARENFLNTIRYSSLNACEHGLDFVQLATNRAPLLTYRG